MEACWPETVGCGSVGCRGGGYQNEERSQRRSGQVSHLAAHQRGLHFRKERWQIFSAAVREKPGIAVFSHDLGV